MRVCLLSPGHLSTNPRIVKEADALTDAGHDVWLIVADFVGWAREADQSFSTRRWRVAETLPFGPLAPRATRVTQIVRQRLARAVAKMGVGHLNVIQAAFNPIAPDIVAAAKRIRADLYIAHYPAALAAAAEAAKLHGGRYAYDAEDFHLGDLPDGPDHTLDREFVRKIEARFLPGCAYVTAASPGIAHAYAAAYGIVRPTVVLNVFPLSQAPADAAIAGTVSPGPSVYWFSQTIGRDRGLECAVRAIGQARTRPHLYLRGRPAGGFVESLGKLASESNSTKQLHILPPAAPAEMCRLAGAHDIGFVGETGHTQNRKIAITNKQFTYLLAGLPCVMSDVPAHQVLSAELGAAAVLYAVDNVAALAEAFDYLLSDPSRLARAREAAFRLGQERFNWEKESQIIKRLVGKLGGSLAKTAC